MKLLASKLIGGAAHLKGRRRLEGTRRGSLDYVFIDYAKMRV